MWELLAQPLQGSPDGWPFSAAWTAAGVAALGSGIIAWLLRDRAEIRRESREDRAALEGRIDRLTADIGKVREEASKALAQAFGAHMDDVRRFADKIRETLDNLARVIAVSRRAQKDGHYDPDRTTNPPGDEQHK